MATLEFEENILGHGIAKGRVLFTDNDNNKGWDFVVGNFLSLGRIHSESMGGWGLGGFLLLLKGLVLKPLSF